jgi:hypothetical protein
LKTQVTPHDNLAAQNPSIAGQWNWLAVEYIHLQALPLILPLPVSYRQEK